MKKKEFIHRLRYRIRNLDKQEINDVVAYYSELIDDRMENGEKEEEAVASLGSLETIVEAIMEERGRSASFGQKGRKRKKLTAGKIVLVILLFPLWIVLGALLFALCVLIGGLVLGIGAATAGILAAGILYAVGSFVHMGVNVYAGLVQLGLSLLLISIGLLFGKYVLRLVFTAGKAFVRAIGNLFRRKGENL